MNDDDIKNDFIRFGGINPPIKRAAYSDRTAWLMAIMSELAYTRLDQEDNNSLLSMAAELAEITDQAQIATKLKELGKVIETRDNSDNKILRELLKMGDFELQDVLFNEKSDTQGFVAVRRADDGMGMAVVSFRGTRQVRDWMTNINAELENLYSSSTENRQLLGKVHRGFNQAYLSVREQVEELLKQEEDLPRYYTGHSLGGALATLATWHTPGDQLAACYTFGAPRVGDDGLSDRYRTPIYRIVNGADPVPFVPPAGLAIDVLKVITRFLSTFISPIELITNRIIKYQGYRHYGYQRYLSICDQGPDGTYPKLKNEFGISTLGRLGRFANRLIKGDVKVHKRIDNYHVMATYRAKLREYAIRRQQNL